MIKAILVITALVMLIFLLAAALLYIAVKIIMTGAFDEDDSPSDVDVDKDGNSD